MNLRQWIPAALISHRNLLKKKKRYPYSNINTHKIGNNVRLGKGSAIAENADIRDGVEIGYYSYVSPDVIIASGTIGNYCSIGYRCQIGMFEHPIDQMSTSPNIYHKKRSILGIYTWDEIQNPPIIGNDVWIGSNVLVLQGVTIGNGSIIGGGAVVTKDIPAYSIAVGVPAKVIRKRFTDDQIAYLEKLKWWELSVDELQKYKYLFESKEKWVEHI